MTYAKAMARLEALVEEMEQSDPNAALREAGLPVLLTYSGQDTVLSANTIAETEAAVSSLPGSTVLTEPFAEGNHNYQNEDAAVATINSYHEQINREQERAAQIADEVRSEDATATQAPEVGADDAQNGGE